MRSFAAFTKKEFLEQLRTYKVLIMFCVLFVFGMMSPLLAKLTPQILADMNLDGMIIQLPEPSVTDAYAQFFKNMTQMGVIIVLLVFGGIISNELTKGTLINLIAKGLPRHSVILSKYTAALVLWTASYCVAAVTNYGYTLYLFDHHKLPNLFLSMFCLWLFVCFALALLLLSGTMVGGSFGGLMLSAGVIILMLLLNIAPAIQKYNPITLASVNADLVAGKAESGDVMTAILITLVLTVISLVAAVKLFQRKSL